MSSACDNLFRVCRLRNSLFNAYVFYARRLNNNKRKQKKEKIEQTLQNTKLYQKVIQALKMSYIIFLTVEL